MPDPVKPHALVWQAVREDDVDQVKRLFKEYPEIREWTLPAFGTWLHYASGHGAMAVLEYLVATGTDVNAKNRDGATPLEEAAARNQLRVVDRLLSLGANLNVDTPLTNALFGCIAGSAMDGHPVHQSGNSPSDRLEIARRLLDAGLDPTVRYDSDNMKQMDSVAFAWMFGLRDIARLIADRIAHGDAAQIEALLLAADETAEHNTEPVPKDEDYRPS